MDKMKLMIVEDDMILSMGLESDLTSMGFIVAATESNGDVAVEKFTEIDPDLVLLDINLEGSTIDGIEVALAIKKVKDIPIIFLSALGGTETLERAKEVNPSYYLIKPCNKRQLQIAIDFALSNYISQETPSVDHSLHTHEPLSNIIFSKNEFFFIKKDFYYHRVNIEDVVFVKAESPGNNIRIITEYEDHFMSIGLKNFESQVRHPYFHRIHRSFLINIEKVIGFNGQEVILVFQGKKKKISIGNTYRDEFMNMFLRLKSD